MLALIYIRWRIHRLEQRHLDVWVSKQMTFWFDRPALGHLTLIRLVRWRIYPPLRGRKMIPWGWIVFKNSRVIGGKALGTLWPSESYHLSTEKYPQKWITDFVGVRATVVQLTIADASVILNLKTKLALVSKGRSAANDRSFFSAWEASPRWVSWAMILSDEAPFSISGWTVEYRLYIRGVFYD